VEKLTDEVVPILILCAVIAVVVRQLPRVEVDHSAAYRRRRAANWLPLGLTYAFLYMGRYNIVALLSKGQITGKEFGTVDAVGSIVYGLSFLVNGPLCDRLGGRFTMLISAAGASACNIALGVIYASQGHPPDASTLLGLFAVNMYFQSFGAVSIVKVNAAWFHLRERGTFGGIFGILISLGVYLAFDWAPKIADLTSPEWLFLAPGVILAGMFVVCWMLVRDNPSDAGFPDFDVADASSGETGAAEPALKLIKRLLTNKTILIIAFISLCAGFLRNGILKWFQTFAQGVGAGHSFLSVHWGMASCIAGITGGMFAGIISDHLFHSRRPPVATVLFSVVLGGAIATMPLLGVPLIATWIVAAMLMAVIGVNGMMSGVASMDFGGKRGAGTATGLIDGFVYFGTAIQDFVYGALLPEKHSDAAKVVDNWHAWPLAMLPVAVTGIALSLTVWNARVATKSAAH
jgi:OPA family glycerol-3-phosphate transporter-like MFS transporter